MNVLVLGGAGYLGTSLVKRLCLDNQVVVVDNLFYKQGYLVADTIKHQNCQFLNIDVMDTPNEAIKKADVIYALHSMVGEPICKLHPEEAQRVNVESIKWLTSKIGKYQQVIYTCSSSGYGKANKKCNEEVPMQSIGLYGKTKEEAEKILMNEVPTAISLRLATVWGRGIVHRLDLLVNDLTWHAVKHKKLSLYEGDFMRTYCHIDDVVDVLYKAKTNHRMLGQIYNVAGDNFSKSQLVEKIKDFVSDLDVSYSEEKDIDERCYSLDCSKINKLGYFMNRTIDTHLQDLIDYYNIVDDNPDITKYMRLSSG